MSGCGCGCACSSTVTSGEAPEKKILAALAKADKPCGSKDIVEATGLEKEVISAEIGKLKKQGLVDSPVRCKYGITADGRASIN